MSQHNTKESQAVNRSLDQSSSNPYEKYSEEWYAWEEKRKIERNLQACEEWEEQSERFHQKFKPQRFTSQEIMAKIAGVFADLPLSASATEQEFRLLEVKQEVSGSVSGRDFDRLVRSFRQDWRKVGYKLELKRLLQIDDPIERNREMVTISSYYQTPIALVKEDLRLMQQAVNTPAAKSHKMDDFFNESSEAIRWLIPGLLPVGETVLLVGDPKDGKTLLALDAAYAIAIGEDEFLGNSFTDRKKVMLISVDESKQSTKAKLIKRGFRRKDRDYVEVIESWDISQMGFLEKRLEDYRPDLVIVDSLKRITVGHELSENSAEFANVIYQMKELFTRYGAAGILIHHTSKNPDAKGVGRARGSSAISGATWGQWQLERIPTKDPNNKKRLRFDPKDPRRIFSAFNRDSDGVQLLIEFNPENNSWQSKGEFGLDEALAKEQATLRQRILTVLAANCHRELSGKDIIDLMNAEEQKGSIYSELSRMVSKRLISCNPASEDKRYNVYSLLKEEVANNTGTLQPPPLPPNSLLNADYVPETITQQALDNSQQLVSNLVSSDRHDFDQNRQNQEFVTVSNSQQADSTEQGGGDLNSQTSSQDDSSTEISKGDTVMIIDDPRFEWQRYEVLAIGFGGLVTLNSKQNPGSRVKKDISSLRRVLD